MDPLFDAFFFVDRDADEVVRRSDDKVEYEYPFGPHNVIHENGDAREYEFNPSYSATVTRGVDGKELLIEIFRDENNRIIDRSRIHIDRTTDYPIRVEETNNVEYDNEGPVTPPIHIDSNNSILLHIVRALECTKLKSKICYMEGLLQLSLISFYNNYPSFASRDGFDIAEGTIRDLSTQTRKLAIKTSLAYL